MSANKTLFVIGGYNGRRLGKCEKLRLEEEEEMWVSLSELNVCNSSCAAVIVGQREREVVFVFAGRLSNMFERMDLNNEQWQIMRFSAVYQGEGGLGGGGGIGARDGCAAVQVRENEILIFGGNEMESWIFNCDQFSVVRGSPMKIESQFMEPVIPPQIFRSHVFAISKESDVHIYSIAQQNWEVIKRHQWF